MLAAIYFYIDEGIRAKHNQQEAIAYHDTQLRNINLAITLADKVAEAAAKEDEFIERFGDRDLLDEAMGQIAGDASIMAQKRNVPAQAYDPGLHPPKPSLPPAQVITVPQAAVNEPAEIAKEPVPAGFSGNGHKPADPT